MHPRKQTAMALILGLGIAGSGMLATTAAASPFSSPSSLMPAMQSTPSTTASPSAKCDQQDNTDQNGKSGDNQNDSKDSNQQGEHEDSGNASPTASDATPASDENPSEHDSNDNESAKDSNGNDSTGADQATPGALDDGQDLVSQATVTVEQAVTAAQSSANGALGSVDLEDQDGALVYVVDIGNQEVLVSATDASVVKVQPQEEDTNDCGNEASVAPGTLDNGADLVSQAKIDTATAVTTAQGAATGELGEVDLADVNGVLTYTVRIGNQEVQVDATTGAVIAVVPSEED
jgi:uncharacterized membrane protein YkoI